MKREAEKTPLFYYAQYQIKALCQELGLTKNNKDADAVKGKLALDCIVAFKRLQKT